MLHLLYTDNVAYNPARLAGEYQQELTLGARNHGSGLLDNYKISSMNLDRGR